MALFNVALAALLVSYCTTTALNVAEHIFPRSSAQQHFFLPLIGANAPSDYNIVLVADRGKWSGSSRAISACCASPGYIRWSIPFCERLAFAGHDLEQSASGLCTNLGATFNASAYTARPGDGGPSQCEQDVARQQRGARGLSMLHNERCVYIFMIDTFPCACIRRGQKLFCIASCLIDPILRSVDALTTGTPRW